LSTAACQDADRDLLEKTIFFARAGMELLQPGNNNLTTAARTNGTSRTNETNRSNGGGGGGGGVLASIPENIIQMAAQLKTDRARPGHLENKTSAWVYSCSLTTAWDSKSGMGIALAIYNGVSCGTQLVARCQEQIT